VHVARCTGDPRKYSGEKQAANLRMASHLRSPPWVLGSHLHNLVNAFVNYVHFAQFTLIPKRAVCEFQILDDAQAYQAISSRLNSGLDHPGEVTTFLLKRLE
jgi:hypothetical protein